MILDKYSIGIGDRFEHQGKAQLQALIKAKKMGINITPVWNKSHREHKIVKTSPDSVRSEADSAVKQLAWQDAYYVDADHINLSNVDLFIDSSDFFTLDVADFIGNKADDADINDFVQSYKKYIGLLDIKGIDKSIEITYSLIREIAGKILPAVKEAGRIYRI